VKAKTSSTIEVVWLSLYNRGVKDCTLCLISKPIEDFYPVRTRNTYTSRCKKCLDAITGKRVARQQRIKGTYENRTYSYRKARNRAIGRGVSFDLTRTERELILSAGNCYYCDEVIHNSPKSIDRVNSDLGYTVSNCVMACLKCNIIKNKHSKDELIDRLRRLECIVARL
jgi:hypothetical protein